MDHSKHIACQISRTPQNQAVTRARAQLGAQRVKFSDK
jgi:hypothetical protein